MHGKDARPYSIACIQTKVIAIEIYAAKKSHISYSSMDTSERKISFNAVLS